MPSNRMNIPEKINVGFQNRNGTYTGKLAYVVYTDQKGKLRKEKSWTSWCDDEIPKQEFENKPMEGFVLNKGVGGQRNSWGWNARNEYIRVYDPRDFEFEISVANLLFILQECTSIKGKGLEGEFVYAWDGKELVLLPCSSKEYIECKKFTDLQSEKVTKKDIVEGCTYLMKDMTEVMYLGRHEWFENTHNYNGFYSYYNLKSIGKRHIFVKFNNNSKKPTYIQLTGFVKLAKRLTDEPIQEYAEAYNKCIQSVHCVLPDKVHFELRKIQKEDTCWSPLHGFIRKNDKYYRVCIETINYDKPEDEFHYIAKDKYPYRIPTVYSGGIKYEKLVYKHVPNRWNEKKRCYLYEKDTKTYSNMTIEYFDWDYIEKLEFYTIKSINKYNQTFDI